MAAKRQYQIIRGACERGHFKGLLRKAQSTKSSEVLKESFKPDLSQPLHYAAAVGNLEVVRELIESHGCDPACRNLYEITPLHCASFCGQTDIVKYLQELYGTDKIVVDRLGACPIAYCTMYRNTMDAPLDYFSRNVSLSMGHVESIKYLLNLRVQNTKRCTLSPQLVRALRIPMHCNSLADFKHIIEILVQFEFQAESSECNTEIYECLYSAIYGQKWDFVRALLLAFPNQIKAATSDIKDSPSFLRTLFEKADVDLIKLFFKFEICNLKANLVTLKQSVDRVPTCFELVQYLLDSIESDHSLSVMDKLLSYIYIPSSYKSKAREQRLVKLIAAYGAGGRDSDGNTVLHLACEYSAVFLIENSSGDLSLINNGRHQLPLHIACKHGNLEIIKLVSSQPGLDVNLQDSAGNTPLHIACKSEWHQKKTDVLSCFRYLLLEKRCSLNIQNNQKQLSLHILLSSYRLSTDIKESILEMCGEGDININTQDSDGMTPLHIACKSLSLSLVRFLTLNFQCDVNLSDKEGNLPIHYAVQSRGGRPYYYHSGCDTDDALEMVKLVGEGCTQIHAKNDCGTTPLHLACKIQNKAIVKYLILEHKKHPLVNYCPASDSIYANLDIHFVCQKEEDIHLLKALANKQNVNQLGHLNVYDDEYGGRACAPLHIACAYNNIPAVRLLGELNCDFSQKDSEDMLPLHIACSKSRSLECVKLLQVHMNDLNAVDREGNTPLHLACKHDCADILKYLQAMYRCKLSIKNRCGELPLHLACRSSLEVVKRVSQCDVNCQTDSGDTPLHIACKAGALDIAKYLVNQCKCKRSMTLYNDSRLLPVHYACEHSLEMVKLVAQPCTTEQLIRVTKTGSLSALDIACFCGSINIAAYLINQKGCFLSALNGDQSALEYASGIRECYTYFRGEPKYNTAFHPDVVKYLVAECGYDPCASDRTTMIHYACQANNVQLVKALTVCSVDIQDSEGNTPLHYACKYSCVEIVQFLIDHNCDQTITNNHGELALHLACQNSLAITQMLTKCDVNTLTFNGNAPLHLACSNWKDSIAVYLIKEAKCDVNIPDKSGNYALHIACSRSLKRATKLMLQSCDINCKDADGNTPLHIACSGRLDSESVTCLLENNVCRTDMPNKAGDLPLHNFVNCEPNENDDQLESATELLVDKCSEAILSTNHEGYTTVQIAIMKGKLSFLQLLHQRKQLDLFQACNKTLLHIACKYRQIQIVRWMLDHGADLNIPDEEGNYPEQLCIEDNNSELKLTIEKQYKQAELRSPWKSISIDPEGSGESDGLERFPKHLYIGADNPSLKTLIELGTISVSRQNNEGNTILHMACQDDRDHILQHILSTNECADAFSISNNDGDTPLHLLATRDSEVLSNAILPLIKCKNPNVKNRRGNTPLHIACQNNNIKYATFLLADLHCDSNVKNDLGEIPLHLAAAKSMELVKLVARSEDVNAQRNDGDTPLHIACRHKQMEVCFHFIDDLNCSVTILNSNEDSPFLILLGKSLGQNSFILEYIPLSESNGKNKNGDTLLHVACQYSTVSTVSYLIKSLKCKTDVVNESGMAPLHFACNRGFINMVSLVSKCNPLAQVSSTTKLKGVKFVQGDTPLHIACRSANVNVVKYLLMNGHTKALGIYNEEGEMPFHLACQHDVNMVRPFVKYAPKFDSSAANLHGDTPLHIACKRINRSSTSTTIELLVDEMNCKTNVVNKDGDLPLHIACRSRRISRKLVNFLCSGLSQENMISQDISGSTALHELLKHIYEKHETYDVISYTSALEERTSWMQRLTETIKYIVQRMPRIDIPDKEGKQPIHLACQYQGLKVVKILCEQYQGSFKQLPEGILHQACLNEDSSVLEHLMKNFQLDHHVNLPNQNGDIPLHIAAKLGRISSVGLLLKKTANIDYANHQGNSPAHVLYLYDYGSKFNLYDYDYDSKFITDFLRLTHAHDLNRLKILTIFIENDVDFSVRNMMGQTPLHFMTARYPDLETVISKRKINVNIQDNEDHTLLHIACQANQLKCVELLLSAGADISIKDKQGRTAIALASEMSIIKFLIEHGADPQPIYEMHRNFFANTIETPPPTPAKLLVIGDPSVGKTTLVQSLKNEGSKSVISDNFDHTTGIVTTTFSSKIYGDVKFFDFAGQPEYYASHDGFLYNILKNIPPTVLILVKLTETEKKIQNRIHYWKNFIENRCAAFEDATHIIIVCSHADCLKLGEDPRGKVSKLHQSVESEFVDKLVLKDVLHINCKLSYSEEMVRLQQVLKESTNELRQEGEMHINSHCFYALLLQTFKDCKVITLGHIVSKLKVMSRDSDKNPLFLVRSDRSAVIQMCKELDDKGHIMFIKHPSITDKSWLILDTQPLLHDLLGTLFAPSSFPQHRPLSYSTGVVPLSLFRKYIGEQDSYTANMLLTFLTRLEYCREIIDKVLLDSIVKQEGYSETEKYYFFPNLVSLNRPNDKWSHCTDSKYSYQCGWLIQCKKEGDFFSPHFIQVLLLRLTFAFAPMKVAYDSKDIEDSEDESEEEENQAMALVIKRTCSVWKNGLYWKWNGMKTIVDIIDQKRLVLLMQCHHGRELQLLTRRSTIISMVLDAKKDFSSKSIVMEYFMHPDCVRHPLKNISKCRLFSLPQIERSIISRDPCVTNDVDDEIDLQELLLFEPYFEFSTDIMKKLSDKAKFHETINKDLLSLIVRDIDRKHYSFFVSFSRTLDIRAMDAADGTRQLANILKQILTRKKHGGVTRRDLHEFFNNMSIFYGRHPPQGIQYSIATLLC